MIETKNLRDGRKKLAVGGPTRVCPLPLQNYPQITMAHGGGGRMMQRLIRDLFLAAFDTEHLHNGHDSALVELPGGHLAMSCDGYVVTPRSFPGGDIGTLAVCGTANDLAMAGARPLYLSASFLIEEGLATEELWQIACSMQTIAARAGISIVTGDTKVLERGKGDGLFISTSGVGAPLFDYPIEPAAIQPGDKILLSGDLGRHGIAVMAAREELQFDQALHSDVGLLFELIEILHLNQLRPSCLRDLTRGGLASALVEIVEATSNPLCFHIQERSIDVDPRVRGLCELLGLDPLHVANEGRMIAFLPPAQAERALELWRALPMGAGATIIGEVEQGPREVFATTALGTRRVIDMLSGEQLPRIR